MSSEIGDKEKLRRISDILLARGAKMLPSEVNVDEWQPVVSYGLRVDDQSFFHAHFSGSLAGNPNVNFTLGSSGGSALFPAGFIYKLKYMSIDMLYGASPLNDEKLRVNVTQSFLNLPAPARTVKILDMAPEDQQPYIRLRAAQTLYILTLPQAQFGTVLPSGLEQIRQMVIPDIILPVPTSLAAPGASDLIIGVSYNDTAGNLKNFPAGSTATFRSFWQKEPISNFNMDSF